MAQRLDSHGASYLGKDNQEMIRVEFVYSLVNVKRVELSFYRSLFNMPVSLAPY